MKLEEAIENLEKQLKHTKKASECGVATKGEFKEDIQAIETILQELSNLQEKNQNLIKYIGNQGMINDYMRYKNSRNK